MNGYLIWAINCRIEADKEAPIGASASGGRQR